MGNYGFNLNRADQYQQDFIYEDCDYINEYDDLSCQRKKKLTKTKINHVDNISYKHVMDSSIKILEKYSDNNEKCNLITVTANPKKRKTQSEIDKEIVDSFYRNPTQKRFSMIWERFYYGIRAHACNIMGDWERAEDMVQETFKRAWEKRNSYSPEKSNYSTWLYTICHNICATTAKRESNTKCIDIDINDMFDNFIFNNEINNVELGSNDRTYYTTKNKQIIGNSMEDITKDLYEASMKEINNMDPLFSQIIQLKNLHDLTLREISEKLEINESKVKNTYYKYKTILSDLMKNKYNDLYNIFCEAKHDKDESEFIYVQYKNTKEETTETI